MEGNNNKTQIVNAFRDKGYYFPIDLFTGNGSSSSSNGKYYEMSDLKNKKKE